MKQLLQNILKEIGVTLNGDGPCDVRIHDPRTYTKILTNQSIGAGESYMDGWWDCDRLDELFYRICRYKTYRHVYSKWKDGLSFLLDSFINQQSRSKSEHVANLHYNLSNKLYEFMLGKSMAYTCGYWKNAQTLDEAQFAKYELTCQKMMLKPGDTVLDIGCGRGGLAKYIAEKHGCEVVALDLSKEAADYAKQLCQNLPVTIYHCDYRDTHVYNPGEKKFDKLVSVGVLEHVGYKNYAHLMDISRSFLKEDGIFLLHSIGGNISKTNCDPWIDKYIFPHGMLPSLKQLGSAFEHRFIVEDLHNFGAFYDKTLMAWHKNLNDHWNELKTDYDERFHRMMNYYLLSCAGGFRARDMQLWQFVLSPSGLLGGFQRPA